MWILSFFINFIMCSSKFIEVKTLKYWMCWLQRTRGSWQIVFFIAAGVYAVGGILFCLLTSGSVQPWAIDKAKSTTELEVMAGKDGRGPIYRPKSQETNGDLPTDPMLTEKA